MSTIKCDIYRINFEKKDSLNVLAQLKMLDIFEPISPLFEYTDDSLKKKLQQEREEYSDTKKALEHLSNILDKQNSDKIRVKDLKKKFDKSKIIELRSLIDNILSHRGEHKLLEHKAEELANQLSLLSPLKNSKVKIASQSELFETRLLKMDVNAFEEIKYDLEENKLITIESIESVEKDRYVVVIYDPITSSLIDQIINKKRIEEIALTITTPTELSVYYQQLQKELENTQRQIEQSIEKLIKLTKNSNEDLKIYADIQKLTIESLEMHKYVGYSFGKEYDHLSSEVDSEEMKKLLNDNSLVKSRVSNSDILHIDGWINPDSIDELKVSLKKIDSNIEIKKLDRDKLSDTRSGVKNVRIFEPFETITNLMGTPSSSEIDPSPFVAPFFIAFFGFALGDAGYGIVITLVTLYALTKVKLSHEAKNGVTLMLYCGLSTIFFGALTGGWFGADLEAIGPVGKFLASFKVFDIASNIILVLIASLAIGLLHQLFGLLLSMYSHIKNGNMATAFWKPGTWILLLISLITFALKGMSPTLESLPWLPILVIALFLFAWGQGEGTKNPVIRLLKGAAGLFGITSYLSNTLSYARLLALALATGVIASVVNLLATIFSGDIPVVSFIIALVILVLGHAFNLLLNLVGTFINVVRLHLVEFFPHFFDAQGVAIQPSKFDSEYIIIEDNGFALDFVRDSQ